jgi:hypothetical protein
MSHGVDQLRLAGCGSARTRGHVGGDAFDPRRAAMRNIAAGPRIADLVSSAREIDLRDSSNAGRGPAGITTPGRER